jgi:hypothetical protein
MSPTGTVRLLVIAGVVVMIVGLIDAGIGGQWDLFALFVIGLGIGAALLTRVESRRPAIPIRRDLVAWLRDRASVSGQPLTAVTDRAIATLAERYRAVSNVDEVRR